MAFFFDTIIISFLIAALLLFISLWHDRTRHKQSWERRHQITSAIILFFLAMSWLTVFWGSFIEPELIIVNQQSIDLPNYKNEPLRIALISDVHVGPYSQTWFITRIVKKIKILNPDVVLIAGDIVADDAKQTKYLTPFAKLATLFPIYAVLGDHDYLVKKRGNKVITNDKMASAIAQALQKNGAQVLSNQAVLLKNKIWLIGIDDISAHKDNLAAALAQTQTNNSLPKIVLVQNPDLALHPLAQKLDLIMAGNTHGGQIRLPWLGPLGNIPDELGQKYDEGLFDINNTRLFITSGIGSSGPRARLFNPPEVALLTIF